jgi:hypothetical protein
MTVQKVSRHKLEAFMEGAGDLSDEELVLLVQEVLDRRKSGIPTNHDPKEKRFVRTRDGQREWIVDADAMTYTADLPDNVQLFVFSVGNVGGRPVGGWNWEMRTGSGVTMITITSGQAHTAAMARREAEIAYWKLIQEPM